MLMKSVTIYDKRGRKLIKLFCKKNEWFMECLAGLQIFSAIRTENNNIVKIYSENLLDKKE